MIEVSALRKAFEGHLANEDISLTIREGEIYGLLGPNGAGKSTFLRMLTGIIQSDEGEIRYNRNPVRAIPTTDFGYMPEERGLYKKMTVMENITYLLELKGKSASDSVKIAEKWLERLQIADRKDARLRELSKGMQQKIQFIATVAHEPPLLILDEPFSGLDPINTQEIIKLIEEIAQSGTTIIFSTHRLDQVEELCNRIGLINNGKVILEGEVAALKQQYFRNNYRIMAKGIEPINEERTFTDSYEKHAYLSKLIDDKFDLHHFEALLPSLSDIFIMTVNSETEVQHG